MNFGDAGVKALFLKVSAQLAPGGLFIFEPQPWSSYKKLNNSCSLAVENPEIELKPHLFKAYLPQIGQANSEMALKILYRTIKIFYVSNQLFLTPYFKDVSKLTPWI